jgi:hypothetical protein
MAALLYPTTAAGPVVSDSPTMALPGSARRYARTLSVRDAGPTFRDYRLAGKATGLHADLVSGLSLSRLASNLNPGIEKDRIRCSGHRRHRVLTFALTLLLGHSHARRCRPPISVGLEEQDDVIVPA